VAQDDKAAADKVSVKYFSKIYKWISYYINLTTNAHNELAQQLHTADPMELMVKIPLVRAAWAGAGLELKDQTASIEHDQLGLVFLYDVMKQYAKAHVTLKVPVMTGAETVGPAPAPGSSTGEQAKYALNVLTSKDRFHVSISKKEFQRRRRENPEFDVEFEGLDSAKRETMYKIFEDIHWKMAAYPPILAPPRGRGWLDLIDYWDFKDA
jgi:hypothetical protein